MTTFDDRESTVAAERPGAGNTTATVTTSSPAAKASATENVLTLLGGIWLVLGLFIDGYAHAEIIETETEDFFTPWHGIFYSGFVFTAIVIGWIAIRRSAPGPVRDWLPPGYGGAAAGVATFAVGGLGDGIWHTIFGVENGVDALLSPTHLLLFIGMTLILTAPLRAFWLDGSRGGFVKAKHESGSPTDPSWSDVGGAIASVAIATALVAFFFTYAFGISQDSLHQLRFDPVTEVNEEAVELGLSTGYVATVILVVPLLGLLRRTDLPTGGVVTIWTVPIVLENLAFGENLGTATLSALIGGLVAEFTLRTIRRRMDRGRSVVYSVGLGVGAMWSTWMTLTHLSEGVRWPPELWSGQIVMSMVVAIGLGLLAFAPPVPASGHRDD